MLKKLQLHISECLVIAALLSVCASCTDLHGDGFIHSGDSATGIVDDDRIASQESRKVFLLYSAGFNSLSSFLKEDFEDLKRGYLPGSRRNDDVMLAYMHHTTRSGNYSTPNPPVLMRLYADPDGGVVTDTLVVYPESTVSASPEQLNEVLSYVLDEFPARSYGMVFSSHATGYLPAGYYTGSKDYESGGKSVFGLRRSRPSGQPFPYAAPDYDPSLPLTKSIGQDNVSVSGQRMSYEMELVDFADAVPMKLDYILFDACLMGGVEVAYQLRNVCRKVGFSQAEVLAEGLDYTTLARHLLLAPEPMPEKVCEDYFLQYDSQSGVHRSATISLVSCEDMEKLAVLCSELFSKYSDALDTVDPSKVQRFYRSGYHWFYDLESILIQAGITDDELADLHDALDECILYKASTPSFMQEFDINIFSGLSMFLPSDGGDRLKEFYKGLDWNKATGLVR